MITQVLRRNDPQEFSFEDPRAEKINELLKRGAFKIVLDKDLPKEANRVEGCLVLAIKTARTNDKVCRYSAFSMDVLRRRKIGWFMRRQIYAGKPYVFWLQWHQYLETDCGCMMFHRHTCKARVTSLVRYIFEHRINQNLIQINYFLYQSYLRSIREWRLLACDHRCTH